MKDTGFSTLFGIDLEDPTADRQTIENPVPKSPKPASHPTATGQVIRLVRSRRKGLTTTQIAAKTGFTPSR